jgi:hypothetical protein
MPGDPPRRGGAWQPTWQQLGGGAFALFAVILAFLAGRVRAGTDPGVARAKASSPAPAAVQPSAPDTSSQGASPGFGDGSGLPQGDGLSQGDGSGAVAPDHDPPTTHAS